MVRINAVGTGFEEADVDEVVRVPFLCSSPEDDPYLTAMMFMVVVRVTVRYVPQNCAKFSSSGRDISKP